jgi:hypothetical protein
MKQRQNHSPTNLKECGPRAARIRQPLKYSPGVREANDDLLERSPDIQ